MLKNYREKGKINISRGEVFHNLKSMRREIVIEYKLFGEHVNA